MRNMTDTGVVRKLDELGRITLPMELRKHLHMEDRESLHIYVDGERIILEKYSPSDVFTGEADNLIEFHGKKVSKNSIKQLAELALKLIIKKYRGQLTFHCQLSPYVKGNYASTPLLFMYSITAPTVVSCSKSSGGISIPYSSSKAITNSNKSKESAPKSSLNEDSSVIVTPSKLNCSVIISDTLSNISLSF